MKVDKHSTGGVGDKTSLIASPLAAAAGVVVPMISGRALGHTGGTLDKLESIPGFRTGLSIEEFREQLAQHKLAFIGQTPEIAPADGKLYSLRDSTATVESIPLIASSIMAKKLAVGLDAMVLDVKVGAGAFMKRQVDARRLAQMMVGIGRRMDKRVQALITDMNQPLGYAIGNALEVMEVSQTLQNAGPTDLTRISLELAARMIYLGKITATLDEARELAQTKLLDGSGYRKFKEVIAAQGGNPQVLDRFELLPNATGAREIASPRAGYVSAIDAEYIGQASAMIGAGRDTKDDAIDPAVGVILEVKVGQKVDSGGVLCRLYYTREEHVDEAAQLVEDAFRISATVPESRELILEVVG
jgi:pyrimidine-nucleoside phosphorylase